MAIPTSGLDQLNESIQKAACLQLLYDKRLMPYQSSPMFLPVHPDRMTPLIRSLPDPLKLYTIQIQDHFRAAQAISVKDCFQEALAPDGSSPGSSWVEPIPTRGEIAQQLINYSC